MAYKVAETVEPAVGDVHDYYGGLVTRKGAPVRVLTLDGLDLADPYVLVTTSFNDAAGDFRNTALGMVETYGDGPESLPIVVATRSAMGRQRRDFRT